MRYRQSSQRAIAQFRHPSPYAEPGIKHWSDTALGQFASNHHALVFASISRQLQWSPVLIRGYNGTA